MRYDRDAIVAAIDRPTMIGLADRLLGAHKGTERSPTWRCPNPDHGGQTGRTPPVSIFADRLGDQRWHCHGCGTGGTAIDLITQARGVGVGAALEELAQLTGLSPLSPGQAPRHRPRTMTGPEAEPARPHRPNPALDRYVAECAAALWQPRGESVLRWLTDARRLPEDVLRANRIGVDLGPRSQPRPDGVPRVRPAVVLPVQREGVATYVQLRTLGANPDFPKYLNSRASIGPNPRVGFYEPARSTSPRPEWIVTEGIFDALAAAAAGYRAAAVLSAAYPDRSIAVRLSRLQGSIVIAFDADPAGQAGARHLVTLLAAERREAATLSLTAGDLNDRAIASVDWSIELSARVDGAGRAIRDLPSFEASARDAALE